MAQREYYHGLISSNPDWNKVGIYLEEGLSGTRAEPRPELKRLMQECRNGRVDMILTKSISRFSRNTTDCIQMVRELSSLGVSVRFEKENIDTETMESELFLSLMACFAEEESRNISDNVKWTIRKRFADGSYRPAIAPYGYRIENGLLIPEQEKAEIVRRIYSMMLSGRGCDYIAEILNRDSIKSPTGVAWNPNTIRLMLQNQVYVGDMLCQKTYTDETFRVVQNRGSLEQYYLNEHHEGIISRKTFERAAKEMLRRRKKIRRSVKAGEQENTVKVQSHSSMSGKVFCIYCGSPMYRQSTGETAFYRCEGRTRKKTLCQMKGEREDSIKNSFLTCLNKLSFSQKQVLERRIIDTYIRSLRGMHGKDTDMEHCVYDENISSALMLREFVACWKAEEKGVFPEEAFGKLVKKADVDTGKQIEFHFRCGLRFIESLRRPR